MSTQQFTIKGWHVLTAMLAFFGTISAVNAVFVTLAIKSFPGEHEEKSYLQGLAFNKTLASRDQQSALGWVSSIDALELSEDGVATITLRFMDSNRSPLVGLSVSGTMSQPVDDNFDQALQFTSLGAGQYQATAANISPGVWRLKTVATEDGLQRFDVDTKVYF
ncbi:MAG: FixH family protein [Pseudomonadota bacterium]